MSLPLDRLREIFTHVGEHAAPEGFDPLRGPCWVWMGRADRYGYGKVSVFGKYQKAHRVFYEAMRGVDLRPSQVLDHECRQRLCCNPNHLAIVTSRANTLRGIAARRAFGVLPLPFGGTRTGT